MKNRACKKKESKFPKFLNLELMEHETGRKKTSLSTNISKFMFFFISNHIPELFFLPRCTVHCTILLMSSHVKSSSSTEQLLKPCHLYFTVCCKAR